ncbi:helicase-related protein [Athalassotoga sp.]|uniref:helicase-related protein n=1 Tax=Athalassotoga sp. TaxID=2022597 RepID=UPI003D00CE03
MSEIITNQEEFLSKIMNDIIPTTKELLFLVGYFYFSGFEQIYKSLKDKDVKILVGLDVDIDYKKIIEYENLISQSLSKENVREQFEKYFVKLFNDTDFFDNKERQESFELFVEKLRNGSLQLRKTLEPNHSKLYLFKNSDEHSENGLNPGTVITGSSNLTLKGLRDQFEINVIIRDKRDFENMEKLFRQFWDSSIEISKEDFDQNIAKNIWFEKIPDPYLIYIRVLDELFNKKRDQKISIPSEITRKKFLDLKYQTDAIGQAIEIIKKHSGVIIADVVGLGKSIIASAVAHNLRMRTIMIVPPHLKEQWEDYRYEFDFNGKVFSSGKMEDALREVNQDSEEKLIIVDEAHRYRNEETQDYAILHKICQSNKVILLTATPYSNKPEDIFSLIKLFQIPTRSTLRTVDNLSVKFSELIKKYKDISRNSRNTELLNDKDIQQIGDEIRDIISPLVIRRSRIDLQEIKEYRDDIKKQNIKFPTVHDPEILEYPLGELRDLYIKTLDKIAPKDDKKGFIGARYTPVLYLKDYESYRNKISETFEMDETLFRQSQINLANFMRRHLVRRFESSMKAFKISLDSMIESSEKILKWYEFGYVPIYKKGDILSPEDLEEYETDEMSLFEELGNSIENKLDNLRKKGYEFIEAKELKVGFKEDVQKDIELLKAIREDWFGKQKADPKLEYFKEILPEKISEGKIVIFSEFADTVDYLYENLKDKFKIISYSASEKYKVEKIKDNFDASSDNQKYDFDILVTTDAMSEGVNLNRANKIFNYDIPYNPTRVIQRIGRINRINKKIFDDIFIYNFFPSDVGEREANVMHITTFKMAMIQAIIGEDTRILTSNEELHSYFARQYKEEEERSWDVEYINFINEIRNSNPELLEKSQGIPKRVRVKRTVDKGKKGVVVFGKKADEYVFKIGNEDSISTITFEEALKLFKADKNEKAEHVSDQFEPIYQAVKSKLFERNSHFTRDRGTSNALKVLKAIKKQLLDDRLKEYIDDLIKVIDEYDDLPKKYMRLIRKMNIKNYNSKIYEIKKEIPHEYIMSIINRAKEIDEGEEVIIFAEEF